MVEKMALPDSFSHLADATDAHVQGLRVAARPIQHFGGQLHQQARALGFALESAGVLRVVVHRQPLVELTLEAHVCVSGALLGPEITRVGGAVLKESAGL